MSPLQIMAAAFAADMSSAYQDADSQTQFSPLAPIAQESNADVVDDRLFEYFCMVRVAFVHATFQTVC